MFGRDIAELGGKQGVSRDEMSTDRIEQGDQEIEATCVARADAATLRSLRSLVMLGGAKLPCEPGHM